MSEHTKEPWEAVNRGDDYADDIDATNESGHQVTLALSVGKVNARRIVACVNACAGLSNDALDGGWTAADLSAYAKQLEQQRDELLEALEKCLPHVIDSWDEDHSAVVKARAAIAKAKDAK